MQTQALHLPLQPNQKIEITELVIPADMDVHGIVLDVISTIAPNAEPCEIEHSTLLAKKLIMLCFIAQANNVTEKVFSEIMQGMLGVRKFNSKATQCGL